MTSTADQNRPTLVISLPIPGERHADVIAALPGLNVRFKDNLDDPATVTAADAIATWRFSLATLAAAPRLRWLQTGGAGVDTLPLADLRAQGVILTNNSGVHDPNIAEHVMAMMLAFARRLPQLVESQARHVWRDEETHGQVFELSGQTVLLFGLGDIGLGVADRAAAFNMNVLGVRRRAEAIADHDVTIVGPDDLTAALASADHVVTSLPLTPATRDLFDTAMFEKFKPGSYLYNVGRGPVVNTDAVIAALTSGQLAGAGLDVVEPEPLPADSPLWDMPGVLITAHTSGATPKYWDRGLEILIDNAQRFAAGNELRNVVDYDEGY